MGKRRQQNPGKDFVKKKRKVGTAKAAPDNATTSTFVSRGISVPAQLVVKSEHVPTTKRKLSFTVCIYMYYIWTIYCKSCFESRIRPCCD